MHRMAKRECETCGREFSCKAYLLPQGKGRFCSCACRGMSIRRPFVRACAHSSCGKHFARQTVRDDRRYCSAECARAAQAVTGRERDAIRFWSKVNRNGPVQQHVTHLGPCWEWMGNPTGTGYGNFWRDGRNVGAHRYSIELATGVDPGEAFVCHRCDNRLCVRPDHLFLGTPTDNIADRDAKHRQARGEKVGTSRLNEQLVHRVFALRAEGMSQPQIAREVGIANQTVSYVLSGAYWSHVGLALKRVLPPKASRRRSG